MGRLFLWPPRANKASRVNALCASSRRQARATALWHGNELVPVGIDFPLKRRPALFLDHLDPKQERGRDPLSQQGTSGEFKELVARTGHRFPS